MRWFFAVLSFTISSSLVSQTHVDVLIDSLNLTHNHSEKSRISNRIVSELQSTDWDRALTYLELAKNEAKQAVNPKKTLIEVYITAAHLYTEKDVLDIALDYYQKAYHLLSEQRTDPSTSAIVKNNMAIIYGRLKDKINAILYFKEVLEYQETQGDSLHMAQVLNNIGTHFLDTDPDSALIYYQRSLLIASTLHNQTLLAYLYTNLGRVYALQENYNQANAYFSKSRYLSRSFVDIYTKGFIFRELSEFYLQQGANDSSIHYGLKTLSLYPDDEYSFLLRDAAYTLYKAYGNQKDYLNAVRFLEKYITITDSLNIEEKAVNVERLKLQQEYQSKTRLQEITREREQTSYLIIGLSLLAGILLLLFILSRYRNKIVNNHLKQELLESRQKELKEGLDTKTQMLIAKAMAEMEQADMINTILEDLKLARRKAVKKETQEALDQIQNKLKKTLNTDLWQEFEISFEQVHPSFFRNLSSKHSELTPKDLRLCALLFLNLSSKEVSQITGQSFKAIENSRTRLRKKLDLTNVKTNISTYLHDFSQAN